MTVAGKFGGHNTDFSGQASPEKNTLFDMARIWQWVVPEYPYHVTQVGVRSMDVLQTDEDRQSYLQFLAAEAGRFEVEILVWCLSKLVLCPRNSRRDTH